MARRGTALGTSFPLPRIDFCGFEEDAADAGPGAGASMGRERRDVRDGESPILFWCLVGLLVAVVLYSRQ